MHVPADTGTQTGTDPALAGFLSATATQHAAELATITAALVWAEAHRAAGPEWAADHGPLSGFLDENDEDPPLPGAPQPLGLAGAGAPLVDDLAVEELAAAAHRSSTSMRNWLGHCLELRYRLPLLYRRVMAGQVQVWRAFKITEATHPLSPDAVAYVDQMIAPYAHSLSWAQLDRTVAKALADHDPTEAERRRAAAAERRCFTVGLNEATLEGTVQVWGCLDAADALDLEHAVRDTATHLAHLGSAAPLDVRRAQALGEIARRDLTLDLTTGEITEPTNTGPKGSGLTPRHVVIHAHLSDSAVAGIDELPGGVLVTQLKEWAATAAKVTIRPIGDLTTCDPVTTYTIPERTKDTVDTRDTHCVFPFCTRPARSCDHDHITPWPHGTTCPCQIAPLCRRHHRTKTHTPWTYDVLEPGTYIWHSPNGLTFHRDHHGTTDHTTPQRPPPPARPAPPARP